MIILKVLGVIDLLSAFVFLMMVFSIHPFLHITLFCSGLLLIKGFFVFTGDVLSVIDIISAVLLLISILFALPAVLLWVPAFLLIAKGLVSMA